MPLLLGSGTVAMVGKKEDELELVAVATKTPLALQS